MRPRVGVEAGLQAAVAVLAGVGVAEPDVEEDVGEDMEGHVGDVEDVVSIPSSDGVTIS